MYLPSKKKYIYIALIILAIAVFFLPFKGAIQNLLIGLSRGLTLAPAKTSTVIEALKKENISLALKVKEQQHLVKENRRLKEAFDFQEKMELSLKGAEVIAFLPSSWRRVIILNIGKDKNIEKGQLAIDESGNLLGKILEVKEDSSSLILANDPDFNLSVFIEDKGFGLLKGNIWGAKILYVEDGGSINKGDRIWAKTPESATTIEIGQVSRIKKNSNSLFWDVDVRLNARNNIFSELFIIK